MATLCPGTVDEAAAALRDLAAAGTPVRPAGSGSRAGWGGRDPDGTVELSAAGLDQVIAHNPGDFTAVLQAGVPLAQAQARFAEAGQWLALDVPGGTMADADGGLAGGTVGGPAGGTIGGLVATADSGPARHRYGGVRDLVIGIVVVLADGTVARAGGTVIKNVAGYDLGKLFTGSFGTLGLIAQVAVRLHPQPGSTATVAGRSDDPDRLTAAALALTRLPLEANSLDVWWHDGNGELLLRFAGRTAAERARECVPRLAGLADVRVDLDDEPLWSAQRARQRQPGGVVLKVAALPADLAKLLRVAEGIGAGVVSRAALGLSWLRLPAEPDDEPAAELVAAARTALAPRSVTVLDGADRVDDPWPDAEPGLLALNRRVKARFDPARIFRPGTFVGGI